MDTGVGARDLAALFHFVQDECGRRLRAFGTHRRVSAEYFEAE
jgi:hypothetical protein